MQNDFSLYPYLPFRIGQWVHIAPQAVSARNRIYQDLLGLSPAQVQAFKVHAHRLYRVRAIDPEWGYYIETPDGQDKGLFGSLNLIPVQSYKGFTIIGRRSIQKFFIHDGNQWEAMIYSPGGYDVGFAYSSSGLYASMTAAAGEIDKMLRAEQDQEQVRIMMAQAEEFYVDIDTNRY